MGIQGVLFDMDGVLFDSEDLIAEAALRLFNETYDVPATAPDFLPFVGTGENRYLRGVAEKYGVTLTMPEDKNQVYAWYLELVPGRLQVLPGAAPFLRACREAGWKTAVATSADRIKLDGNLAEAGWQDGMFDALVSASDISQPKPAPEIFETAAAKLGLAPSACLVIEDALSGIQAAKAAGCRCLAVTTSFPRAELVSAGADFVADRLDEPQVWAWVQSGDQPDLPDTAST